MTNETAEDVINWIREVELVYLDALTHFGDSVNIGRDERRFSGFDMCGFAETSLAEMLEFRFGSLLTIKHILAHVHSFNEMNKLKQFWNIVRGNDEHNFFQFQVRGDQRIFFVDPTYPQINPTFPGKIAIDNKENIKNYYHFHWYPKVYLSRNPLPIDSPAKDYNEWMVQNPWDRPIEHVAQFKRTVMALVM